MLISIRDRGSISVPLLAVLFFWTSSNCYGQPLSNVKGASSCSQQCQDTSMMMFHNTERTFVFQACIEMHTFYQCLSRYVCCSDEGCLDLWVPHLVQKHPGCSAQDIRQINKDFYSFGMPFQISPGISRQCPARAGTVNQ